MRRYLSLYAHQIFFLDTRLRANQLPGNASILRKNHQSPRIDIQPPCWSQAFQMHLIEMPARLITTELGLQINQAGRWLIAGFRLAGYIADRLIQQYGDLTRLLRLRPLMKLYFLYGIDPGSQ